MSIQDLGSIGEFLSSLAVVASLVYLALQTRANTRAVKAQTRSSITDQLVSIMIATFQSAEQMSAALKSRRGDTLSDAERMLVMREALMFFRHMENVQYQYEAGLYDPAEFRAQRAIWSRRFANESNWREAWNIFEYTMSPRLRAEVERIFDELEGPDGAT